MLSGSHCTISNPQRIQFWRKQSTKWSQSSNRFSFCFSQKDLQPKSRGLLVPSFLSRSGRGYYQVNHLVIPKLHQHAQSLVSTCAQVWGWSSTGTSRSRHALWHTDSTVWDRVQYRGGEPSKVRTAGNTSAKTKVGPILGNNLSCCESLLWVEEARTWGEAVQISPRYLQQLVTKFGKQSAL